MAAEFDKESVLAQVDAAVAAQKLTAGAAVNLRKWLLDQRYAAYLPEVFAHLQAGQWQQLDDVFWTVIPFGTGGRRGRMYPIGSNAINDRTIGESAQGVADYVLGLSLPGQPSCAIAYDTRHRSRHFAELCAEIFAGNGFQVYFLDGYRSTPELSYAVRHTGATVGVMVTASHNPPSDNAVKVYWSTGGQVLPPHDKGIIACVLNAGELKRVPFTQALSSGQVKYVEAEIDPAFIKQLAAQGLPGPRELKILYSPLHGVGASAVLPALAADGFTNVELFAPHAQPDGDFPNVPGHVANPENPRVFDAAIEQAQATGVDLVLASDPDCDRLGCAAPLTKNTAGAWGTFTGNQIAALLCEYLLSQRKAAGTLSPRHYVVKTLVTSEVIRKIADSHGVRCEGNLQVGFKYIGQAMDQHGPELFVFGCEESHGYLVGQYARDKDAAVAAMLLAEYAARLKATGKTLHDALAAIYWQYGYHLEKQVSLTMPGSQGMKDMQTIMGRFRTNPPRKLGNENVREVRDYQSLTKVTATSSGWSQPVPFDGPMGDMVILELAGADAPEGNFIAARPSGTEPKIKFYTFAYEPAELLGDLAETAQKLSGRIEGWQRDLAEFGKV
ncbi:MAG: phospho-sugar mutase [Pirellulales bacterium]|nr:phospho-sugar mutase [Pirellulales bacterium]